MKVCLYSPYIPKHVGGGEKYLLDVALTLARKHVVFIALPKNELKHQEEIRQKYESFLQTSLRSIHFIESPLGTSGSALKKFAWTKQFDLLYYVTDGSLFFSAARKNILHIQFPLQLDKSSFIEQLKLANWRVKNTNSVFTKQVVEKSWPVQIDVVHHPKVDVDEIQQATRRIKKEKIILSVGRFFRHLHSKRQDVLVTLFHHLRKQHPNKTKGWKLVLIGGVEDQTYVDDIRGMIGNAPIELLTNVDRAELLRWYGKASIYWHAAGYGVDPSKHPEKVEHFGISTVEAMAAGCAPLVHGKGGQIEVVGDRLRELVWMSDEECLKKTEGLITHEGARQKIAQEALRQARLFDAKHFEQKLWYMVGE